MSSPGGVHLMTDVVLTEQQAETIIREAIKLGLYELDTDGTMPVGEDCMKAATTLVGMALLSHKAGARDDDVAAIIAISTADAQAATPQGEDVATEQESNPMAAIPDDTLIRIHAKMQQSLESGGDVTKELTEVQAELGRRGLIPTVAVAPPAPAQATTPAAQVTVEEVDVDPAVEAAERTQLENQLTLAIMRAHKVDPSEVEGMSLDTLRWIIAHPTPAIQPQEEAEVAGEAIETTHIVVPQPQVLEIPPATVTAATVTPTSMGDITPEREELEGKVTGPLLKIYGRGRQDVPNIGINELRFMIEHPDGRAAPEDLAAAQALDRGEVPAAVAPAAPAPPAPQVPAPVPATEAPPEATPFDPPAAAVPEVAPVAQTAAELLAEAKAEAAAVQAASPTPTPAAPVPAAELHHPIEATRDAEEHFNEILEREHFPIPADIEEPPQMPADMSKLSREEIYSLHARFHACETRILYVISGEEDALSDMQKLRRSQELAVEETIPMSVEGKKLTEAQRQSRVASDQQVQIYARAEHNAEKTIKRLKVLAGNFHKDVERCSRQLTRWSREYEGD